MAIKPLIVYLSLFAVGILGRGRFFLGGGGGELPGNYKPNRNSIRFQLKVISSTYSLRIFEWFGF
jgi:hypothetical protein